MVERTLSMREAQGSIPCSSTFCGGVVVVGSFFEVDASICGRVVKAPDSSSGQLCWREFDPHRMYFFGDKKMAVPGVEPGSSGSQPLMLTTTPYDRFSVMLPASAYSSVERETVAACN